MTHGKRPTEILVYLDKMLPELEALYKDYLDPMIGARARAATVRGVTRDSNV